MNRRNLLKLLGASGVYGSLGFAGLPQLSFANSCSGGADGAMVVIFLRGANDGMNMLAPNELNAHVGDGNYVLYSTLREKIGLDRGYVNSASARVLGMNGEETGYSIHPSLAPLKPLIDDRRITFFPGTHVGITTPQTADLIGSMSHFVAQDIIDIGGYSNNIRTLKTLTSGRGWVARALASQPDDAMRVFGFSDDKSLLGLDGRKLFVSSSPETGIQRTYGGYQVEHNYLLDVLKRKIANTPDGENAAQSNWKRLQDQFLSTVDELSDLTYVSPYGDFVEQGKRANTAGYGTERLARTVDVVDANGNKQSVDGLRFSEMGNLLSKTATLLKADQELPGLQVVTLNQGDYDTHDNQRARQDGLLSDLAKNLAAFHQDMSSSNRQVEVVVVTEFGRTFDENDNGGTDHGQAFTAMVMGAGQSAQKQKVICYGNEELNSYTESQPPLFQDDLVFRRGARYYVRPIQDYRDIISEIMDKRLTSCDNPFNQNGLDYMQRDYGYLV